MQYTYKNLAYIKIILWIVIIITTLFTINVASDEILWVVFLLLGVFLLSWWVGYFIFRLIQYALKQYHKYEHEKMTEAYKLSFLFSCYVLTNIILLIMEKRSRLLGINLLIGFIIMQILLVYDREDNDR